MPLFSSFSLVIRSIMSIFGAYTVNFAQMIPHLICVGRAYTMYELAHMPTSPATQTEQNMKKS